MTYDIIYGVFIFIFGLLTGSFLNVIICRVPDGRSIVRPGSSCPSCGTRLKWTDLVPVASHIFLKGRCRYCGIRISSRYTLVELMTAVLSLLMFLRFGLTYEFFIYLALLYILLPCFFIDLEHMIIPNGLIITGLALIVPVLLLRLFVTESKITDNIFGGLAGGGILLLIYITGYLVYKKEALGFGDVKLFFVIGLFLGLKSVIIAFLFSIFIGAAAGIIMMVLKKKEGRSEMPFGPFIVTGSVMAIFIGELVYNWYMGIF